MTNLGLRRQKTYFLTVQNLRTNFKTQAHQMNKGGGGLLNTDDYMSVINKHLSSKAKQYLSPDFAPMHR